MTEKNNVTIQAELYDAMKLELVVHDSIDSILDAFMSDLSDSDGCELIAETVDDEGHVQAIIQNEYREYIEINGLWGFAMDGVVNVWADLNRVTFENLLFFFGHEVGHTIPYSGLHDDSDDLMGDEKRADMYGFVAKESYRLARNVWSTRGEINE
jgi:hypothetical protein